MNSSGFVGHATIIGLNVHYCMLFSSRVRARVRVSVRIGLVSG